MARRRSRTDAHQAGNLRHFQSRPTVEQEIAGHPRGGILPVPLLKKVKRRLEDRPLYLPWPSQALRAGSPLRRGSIIMGQTKVNASFRKNRLVLGVPRKSHGQ